MTGYYPVTTKSAQKTIMKKYYPKIKFGVNKGLEIFFKILMNKYYLIVKELFYVLSGALLIFSFLEIIWPGVVLAYININWALILWLIAGIVMLIKSDNT